MLTTMVLAAILGADLGPERALFKAAKDFRPNIQTKLNLVGLRNSGTGGPVYLVRPNAPWDGKPVYVELVSNSAPASANHLERFELSGYKVREIGGIVGQTPARTLFNWEGKHGESVTLVREGDQYSGTLTLGTLHYRVAAVGEGVLGLVEVSPPGRTTFVSQVVSVTFVPEVEKERGATIQLKVKSAVGEESHSIFSKSAKVTVEGKPIKSVGSLVDWLTVTGKVKVKLTLLDDDYGRVASADFYRANDGGK